MLNKMMAAHFQLNTVGIEQNKKYYCNQLALDESTSDTKVVTNLTLYLNIYIIC